MKSLLPRLCVARLKLVSRLICVAIHIIMIQECLCPPASEAISSRGNLGRCKQGPRKIGVDDIYLLSQMRSSVLLLGGTRLSTHPAGDVIALPAFGCQLGFHLPLHSGNATALLNSFLLT